MQDNPYAAPHARVADRANARVPHEILAKIKGAVVAGIVSATITGVLVVAALIGKPLFGVDAWSAIDVVLVLGLTYGVHRRSRTCAILLLLLFVAGRILMMVGQGQFNGILMSVIFAYYYGRGVMGTFEYHRFIRDPARPAAHEATLDAATNDRIAGLEALRPPAQVPTPADARS